MALSSWRCRCGNGRAWRIRKKRRPPRTNRNEPGVAGTSSSRTAAAYSPALTGSTIGDGGLNFSVRDGKRWDPASIAAFIRRGGTVQRCPPRMRQERDTSRRRNETYGQLVRVGFAVAGFAPPAYPRGSLPRPLNGDLISEGASRLDAFSAYHFRTWLPGGAAGATTGTPEVRPSRSSRTKDGAPQISHARNR